MCPFPEAVLNRPDQFKSPKGLVPVHLAWMFPADSANEVLKFLNQWLAPTHEDLADVDVERVADLRLVPA